MDPLTHWAVRSNTRSALWSDGIRSWVDDRVELCRQGPTSSTSWTTAQPVGRPHVVSRIIVPGMYRIPDGTVTSGGPSRNEPASRSSIAANTLGPSILGRHIHSTLPLGATSAETSQSDRKP